MPPRPTLSATIEAHDRDADPVRRVGDRAQRHARALELRHEVTAADQQHDPRREQPHVRRGQPGLGEVGDRVGAEAPQRGGDEQQQRQVARGEADRQPQRAGAELQHQPGHAEEARGAQVLAGDRRRVPPRRDRPRGHEQVGRGAREPDAVGADPERGARDRDDARMLERQGSSTRSRNASSRPSARRCSSRPMKKKSGNGGTTTSQIGSGTPRNCASCRPGSR